MFPPFTGFQLYFFSHLFGGAILHTWDKRARSLLKTGGFTRKQVTHHALELLSDWITGGQRNDSNSGSLTHHHQLFLSLDQKKLQVSVFHLPWTMFLHSQLQPLAAPFTACLQMASGYKEVLPHFKSIDLRQNGMRDLLGCITRRTK